MAKRAVQEKGVSIKLACEAFQVSETCYRYQPECLAENDLIADWLTRLIENRRNWGLWSVLPVSAQLEGPSMESQAGLSDLQGIAAELTDQA
jgi:hypothetical protein